MDEISRVYVSPSTVILTFPLKSPMSVMINDALSTTVTFKEMTAGFKVALVTLNEVSLNCLP